MQTQIHTQALTQARERKWKIEQFHCQKSHGEHFHILPKCEKRVSSNCCPSVLILVEKFVQECDQLQTRSICFEKQSETRQDCHCWAKWWSSQFWQAFQFLESCDAENNWESYACKHFHLIIPHFSFLMILFVILKANMTVSMFLEEADLIAVCLR